MLDAFLVRQISLRLSVALNLKNVLQLQEGQARGENHQGWDNSRAEANFPSEQVPLILLQTHLQVVLTVRGGVRVLDIARDELEHVRAVLQRFNVGIELLVVDVNRIFGVIFGTRLHRRNPKRHVVNM
jgi:hypothetical protein